MENFISVSIIPLLKSTNCCFLCLYGLGGVHLFYKLICTCGWVFLISSAELRAFSPPMIPDLSWGPPSFLFNEEHGPRFRGQSGRPLTLTIHFQLVPRLYPHSSYAFTRRTLLYFTLLYFNVLHYSTVNSNKHITA